MDVNWITTGKQRRQSYGRAGIAWLAYGMWRLGLKQWAKHAPYYRLKHDLVHWNEERLAQAGKMRALNAQEITALRTMIEQAGQRSCATVSPALLDQWFFMAIGAIQVQSQAQRDHAWQLFEQSVHSQLGEPARQRMLWTGLVTSLCVLWLMWAPVKQTPMTPAWSPLEIASGQTEASTVDPVTLSLLNLAYQKMQNGSCQLPQAAMLPEKQRQAFILFVTEGTVDASQVEHLRQALGYVSCLYPQELMRPQGRDRVGNL